MERTCKDSTKNNEICIVSPSSKYLDIITNEVDRILGTHNIINIPITKHHMKTDDPASFDDVRRAQFVLLVATYSQRLIIISDSEHSQMGTAYEAAERSMAQIFLILAAHDESNELPQDQLFHRSFSQLLESQPKIKELSDQERFISIGTHHKKPKLDLNPAQEKRLVNWIQEGQRNRRNRETSARGHSEGISDETTNERSTSINSQQPMGPMGKTEAKKRLFVVGASVDHTYLVKAAIIQNINSSIEVRAVHQADIETEDILPSDFLLIVLVHEHETQFLTPRSWQRLQSTIAFINEKEASTFIVLVENTGDEDRSSSSEQLNKYESTIRQNIDSDLLETLDMSRICSIGKVLNVQLNLIFNKGQLEAMRKWMGVKQVTKLPTSPEAVKPISNPGSTLVVPPKENKHAVPATVKRTSQPQVYLHLAEKARLVIVGASRGSSFKNVLKGIKDITKRYFQYIPIKDVDFGSKNVNKVFGSGLGRSPSSSSLSSFLCVSRQEQDSERAPVFMLVGIGSENLVLTNGSGQFDEIYKDSRLNKSMVFMILADHHGSNNLRESESFDANLRAIYTSQPEVKQLAEKKQFISVGTIYKKKSEMMFNRTQEKHIIHWLGQYFHKKTREP